MTPGTRIEVTRGGHKGRRGTVAEDPGITLGLTVGGVPTSPPTAYPLGGPGLVLVKFDDDLGHGVWGTGLFRYTPAKLRVIIPLVELAEQAE